MISSNKAMALPLLAVLLLSVAGLGIAHWEDRVYIDGTVETGTLCAEIIAGDSWDSEPPEKDFSGISCYAEDTDGDGVPDTLFVTVTNAYPCIDYYQDFEIHNCGTIPLHIYEFNPIGDIDPCITVDIQGITVGQQLHPCESAYGTVYVHVEQCAEQGETYTFAYEIVVVQWNYGP